MSRTRLLGAGVAAAVLTLPVAAAPAKTGSTTVKVATGATALRLDGGTAQALTSLGLKVSALRPAKARPSGAIAFPVTTGRLDAKSYAGVIRHSGGLRFASGSTKVDLRNLRIVVDKAPHLTARVGGSRLSIADLDLSTAKITKQGRRLTIARVGVTLTAGAATALDQAFGTDALKGGIPLGMATVRTRVR